MEPHPRLEEMQRELIEALGNPSREHQQRMLERVLEKVLSLKRDFRAQFVATASPCESTVRDGLRHAAELYHRRAWSKHGEKYDIHGADDWLECKNGRCPKFQDILVGRQPLALC